MKRSDRLGVVLRLYQQKEDQLSVSVQAAQAERDTQRARLEQLVDYQRSYQASARANSDAGAQSMSIAQWRRLQDYIEQLTVIIRQQEQQVGLSEAEVERAEARWRSAHLERRSMESAIERIALEEQRAADRAEQKQIDEMVQQMRARRMQGKT